MKEDCKYVLKPRLEFTPQEIEKVIKSNRALNMLFSCLDTNEFNRLFACHEVKEG